MILAIWSLALVLVAYFDLATNAAFGDEWMYRWSAQRLAAGQGFNLWPQVVPVSLAQTLASMPVAIFHPEPRFLRLTVLPFLVLWSVMSGLIARRFRADGFWTIVAAVVVPLAPLSLWVSASFSSDIAYVALLVSAAWLGLRWTEQGRGAWWFVLLATLATTQRQQGLALAVAATAIVPLRRRPWRPGDGFALAATWLGTAVALLFPFVFGIASHQETTVLQNQGTQHLTIGAAVGSLVELGPMLGLLFVPLAPGLWRRGDAERLQAGRWELPPMVLAMAGAAASLVFAAFFGISIWPGDVWGFNGRGPLTISGAKPPLFELWEFVAMEILVVAVFVVLLGWRRRLWTPRLLASSGAFLVVLALAHLPPMALAVPLDRYYLPVAAVLAPFVAARLSANETPGRGATATRVWVITSLAAGLALFVVGHQDFLAWQSARAEAQARAYAIAGPAGVDAGYDANGSGFVVPRYDQTGDLVDPVHLAGMRPRLALRFAGPGDPRPGVGYNSVAPGKIVIVCLRAIDSCPLRPRR